MTASFGSHSSSTRKTWVIVGASRGIGHEFVEQLLARGDEVYATVRGDTASFFTEHKSSCHVLNCDVTSERSINVRYGYAIPTEHLCHLTWRHLDFCRRACRYSKAPSRLCSCQRRSHEVSKRKSASSHENNFANVVQRATEL